MKRCLLLLFVCVAFAAGAAVQAPYAGTVRSVTGAVYPMQGLSRALIAGQPFLTDASAAAFGDSAGIVAVEDGLTVIDPSGTVFSHWDGDAHKAMLGIQDAPLCAIAWLPGPNSIVTFAAGVWKSTILTFPLPGTVIAIRRVSKDTAHLLLSEGDQVFEVTVGLASGNLLLQRLIPEVRTPATYFAGGLLFQDGDLLVYENTAAGKKTLRFDGHIDSFEQMSERAVHALGQAPDAQWMLELTRANNLSSSQLPVPSISLAGGAR